MHCKLAGRHANTSLFLQRRVRHDVGHRLVLNFDSFHTAKHVILTWCNLYKRFAHAVPLDEWGRTGPSERHKQNHPGGDSLHSNRKASGSNT